MITPRKRRSAAPDYMAASTSAQPARFSGALGKKRGRKRARSWCGSVIRKGSSVSSVIGRSVLPSIGAPARRHHAISRACSKKKANADKIFDHELRPGLLLPVCLNRKSAIKNLKFAAAVK
jgi:hypothetical protein